MIGGNIQAILQEKDTSATNSIGERITQWKDVQTLTGWLDLSGGDSKYTYNAKIQESTHVFLCDYIDIGRDANDKRMVVNGLKYDVLLIDNPMELNEHLEIYLRFVG